MGKLVRACLLMGAMLIGVAVCGLPSGPPDFAPDVHVGEEAKARILKRWTDLADSDFADAAKNWYFCEGGSFNGSIVYYMIEFASGDACLDAFERLSGKSHDELSPWKPSKFAVVMDGPNFYWPELANVPWDLWSVTRGFAFESMRGEHQSLDYYAVDLDKNRL